MVQVEKYHRDSRISSISRQPNREGGRRKQRTLAPRRRALSPESDCRDRGAQQDFKLTHGIGLGQYKIGAVEPASNPIRLRNRRGQHELGEGNFGAAPELGQQSESVLARHTQVDYCHVWDKVFVVKQRERGDAIGRMKHDADSALIP
jgi:hypothetical protein